MVYQRTKFELKASDYLFVTLHFTLTHVTHHFCYALLIILFLPIKKFDACISFYIGTVLVLHPALSPYKTFVLYMCLAPFKADLEGE